MVLVLVKGAEWQPWRWMSLYSATASPGVFSGVSPPGIIPVQDRSQVLVSSHLLLSVLAGTPMAKHDFNRPCQAWVLLTGPGWSWQCPRALCCELFQPLQEGAVCSHSRSPAQLSPAPILSRRGRRVDAPRGCPFSLCLLLVPNPELTPSASVQTDCLFLGALFHLSP